MLQEAGITNYSRQQIKPNTAREQATPTIPSQYVRESWSSEGFQMVKTALTDITSLLNNVVQRVERVEYELHQQRTSGVSSSSDSSPRNVPLVVG